MNIITAGTRKIVIPNFGPVVPARPGGGAAAFDPQDIAGMFSRFDHTTAVYTDTGGTTPAASNGDAVRRWDDGTGTQNATEGSVPPVLRTGANGINGERAVYFGGANYLFLTGLTQPSGSFTFYFVIQPDVATGVTDYLFDTETGRFILAHLATNDGQTGWHDGTWRNIAAATTDAQILTYVFDSGGSQGEMFRGQTSLGTATYTAKAIGNDVKIGAQYNSSGSAYTGKMGALLGYTGAHNATQRGQVWGYLESAFF